MRTKLMLLSEMLTAMKSPARWAEGLGGGACETRKHKLSRLTNGDEAFPLLRNSGTVLADKGLTQHEGQQGHEAEPHVAAGQQQGKGKSMDPQHLHTQILRPGPGQLRPVSNSTRSHPAIDEIHCCRAGWGRCEPSLSTHRPACTILPESKRRYASTSRAVRLSQLPVDMLICLVLHESSTFHPPLLLGGKPKVLISEY